MQTSHTYIEVVTEALVTEEQPHIYVAEAARLGFVPGAPPPAGLETDLGNGRRFRYIGLDDEGTAIYCQNAVLGSASPITLRVLGADPERAKPAALSAQRAFEQHRIRRQKPKRKPDALQIQLTRLIDQSNGIREGLLAHGSKSEAHLIQALKAGLTDSLRILYLGMHAREVLVAMAEASDGDAGERAAALQMASRRLDSWLESWTPETCASPVTILHHSIEFEVIKEIASLLRQNIKAGEGAPEQKQAAAAQRRGVSR